MKVSSYLNIFFILILTMLLILFSTLFFKFFPNLSFFRPNFILLLVVYLAIHRDFYEGVILSFIISYFENLHSPGFVGAFLFVNIFIFIVINFISNQVYVRNLRIVLIVVTSVVVSEKLLTLGLLYFFRDLSSIGMYMLKRVFVEIPITVLFSIPLFQILRKLDFSTGVKEKKTDFFSGPIYLRRV